MREAAPRSAKGSVPTRDNAAESLGQEGVRCAANQNQNKKERKIKNEIICTVYNAYEKTVTVTEDGTTVTFDDVAVKDKWLSGNGAPSENRKW